MSDRLMCERIHDDGRCNHPVTGERHGGVIPAEWRAICSDPGCGWTIRRDPADHPGMEAVCVNHLDDDEWMDREYPTPPHTGSGPEAVEHRGHVYPGVCSDFTPHPDDRHCVTCGFNEATHTGRPNEGGGL